MRRILLLFVVVVAVVLVAPLAAYGLDRLVGSGEVARNVTAGGDELSGLSEEDVLSVVLDRESRLAATSFVAVVDGKEVAVERAALGFDLDEEAVAHGALTAQRSDGLPSDFRAWATSWRSPVDLTIPVSVDSEAVDDLLAQWERTLLDRPAFVGALAVDGGVAVPAYPSPGYLIDRAAAAAALERAALDVDSDQVVVPLRSVPPGLERADLDTAAELANELIDEPVKLVAPLFESSFTFARSDLIRALRIEVIAEPPERVDVWLDAEALIATIERVVPQFETEPVSASFTFDEDAEVLSIIPSIDGLTVGLASVPAVVEMAALTDAPGELPLTVGRQPRFTTAMAEAMGPLGKVSEFTTYHPCCASRVINIQTIADAVDGALVWPGETFSINDHVGRRTTAKGYVRAGAIINGELYCCDSAINIGGGTSQFATTFYNAVFFGCYEDVEHKPHSLYFSRYPRGREATLGYPKPDVVFRNDSDAVVWIDTSYTGSSITVAFHGNTGDRTCTSERSGSWTTRVITYPDGTFVREPFRWVYRRPKTTSTVATTTTTMPPSATTTTVAPTTTTSTTTTLPPETSTTTTTVPP